VEQVSALDRTSLMCNVRRTLYTELVCPVHDTGLIYTPFNSIYAFELNYFKIGVLEDHEIPLYLL